MMLNNEVAMIYGPEAHPEHRCTDLCRAGVTRSRQTVTREGLADGTEGSPNRSNA
jgi:hypothetical protein